MKTKKEIISRSKQGGRYGAVYFDTMEDALRKYYEDRAKKPAAPAPKSSSQQ